MKILVCLDGSGTASRVLPAVARTLAALPAAELHLLQVLNPDVVRGRAATDTADVADAAILSVRATAVTQFPRVVEDHGSAMERIRLETTEELQRLARERFPQATVVTHIEWSHHPAQKIVQAGTALDVDVIAMATHGRSGVSHLVTGSVTEQVLRTSTIPVLVVGPSYPQ
ncbi:MAG: universal stress protein [Anaerolineaceae bacterium]